jgi:hypothetical protein
MQVTTTSLATIAAFLTSRVTPTREPALFVLIATDSPTTRIVTCWSGGGGGGGWTVFLTIRAAITSLDTIIAAKADVLYSLPTTILAENRLATLVVAIVATVTV